MIGRDDGQIHRAAERFKPINYLREVAVLGIISLAQLIGGVAQW